MDVAVLAPQSNLSTSYYRQRKNGTVETGKIKKLVETKPEKKGRCRCSKLFKSRYIVKLD
jgi:hypothetical protein